MIAYQWTTAAIGIVLGAAIITLVRKDLLHTRYSFMWLCLALAAVVLGVFPRIADWVGKLLGVSYPPILIMLVGLGVMAVKILMMDIDRSHQEIKLRRLAHRLAMLEADMEKDRAERGGDSDDHL